MRLKEKPASLLSNRSVSDKDSTKNSLLEKERPLLKPLLLKNLLVRKLNVKSKRDLSDSESNKRENRPLERNRNVFSVKRRPAKELFVKNKKGNENCRQNSKLSAELKRKPILGPKNKLNREPLKRRKQLDKRPSRKSAELVNSKKKIDA